MLSRQPTVWHIAVPLGLLVGCPLAVATAQPPTDNPAAAVRSLHGATVSRAGATLAFLSGDTLWIQQVGDGSLRPVSGSVGDEFRIMAPFLAWTPTGDHLLFREGVAPVFQLRVYAYATGGVSPLLPDTLDQRIRTLGPYWLGPPDWAADGRRVAFIGALDREPGMQVWIADRESRSVRKLEDSRPAIAATWRPGADQLVVSRGSLREGGVVQLASPATGEILDVLLSSPSGQIPLKPIWHPSGDTLLVPILNRAPRLVARSGETGWSEVSTRLPAGQYLGWLKESGELVGTFSRGAMGSGVARVSPADGAPGWMTAENLLARGVGLSSSRSAEVVAAVLQSGALPPDVWVARSGQAFHRLTTVNAGPAAEVGHDSRVIRWTAAAGGALPAQLLLPRLPGAAPRPLVVVPYDGYRDEFPSPAYFLDALVLQLLANGWAVVRPNTSAGNDQQTGYGRVQLADTERLVETLVRDYQVDRERVAVLGHSHGASLAYYYATKSPTFCAVIAINGRADWIMQARYDNDGLLPRPLGATPDEDPALYRRESPVANAEHARAPLLAVAGHGDRQILPENARAMVDSLRRYGRPGTLLEFGDEDHWINRHENRERLWAAIRATLQAGCPPQR